MSWSAWITPDPDVYSAAVGRYAPGVLGQVADPAVPHRPDFGAVIEGYRLSIAAGDGELFENYAVMASAAMQAVYDVGTDTTAMFAAAGQGYLLLHGSQFADQLDYDPPELSGLVRGLDYDVRPDRSPTDVDAYVQYEAEATSFLGWQDWVAHLVYSAVSAETSDLGVLTAESPWDGAGFALRLAYAALMDQQPVGTAQPWRPYGYGTTLGSVSVPIDLSPGAYPSGAVPPIDRTIPLSAIPVPDCTVLMQPSFLDTLSLPNPNPASDSAVAAVTVGFAGEPTGPFLSYQRPRWRYWIPPATAAPMRLLQRNDGLGPSGHARIVSSSVPNGASSTQRQRPPRIGTANVIDPGPNYGRPSL